MSILVHGVACIYTILDKESVVSDRRVPTHSSVSSLLSHGETYCGLQWFSSLGNAEQTDSRGGPERDSMLDE